ncbi:hypothetical protein HN51_044817 [Arachis hypogaea]
MLDKSKGGDVELESCDSGCLSEKEEVDEESNVKDGILIVGTIAELADLRKANQRALGQSKQKLCPTQPILRSTQPNREPLDVQATVSFNALSHAFNALSPHI